MGDYQFWKFIPFIKSFDRESVCPLIAIFEVTICFIFNQMSAAHLFSRMVSNNQINNIIFHLFYQTKWTYFQNVWQQIHTHSFPWWYQTKKNKRFHIMEWIRFVSRQSCLSTSQTQNSLLSITCKNSLEQTISHHRRNSFGFMSMDNHLGYQSIFCQKSFSSE